MRKYRFDELCLLRQFAAPLMTSCTALDSSEDSNACSRLIGSHSMLRFNYAIMYFLSALEQIEVRECLLLFGAESFVFQFAIKIAKDQDI